MECGFTDRYQALGIPYPDPETMCKGQCEGTGWVPVAGQIDNVDGLLYMDDPNEDPQLIEAWRKAHSKSHTLKGILKACWSFLPRHPLWAIRHLWEGWKCDGWHFIKCPDCNGTGTQRKGGDSVG